MNRALRRASAASLRSDARRSWESFDRIPESERPELWVRTRERIGDLESVWKNNIYIVQIYRRATTRGPALHLAIRRNDEEEVHGWSDLQRIKNEVVGEHRVAIEVYPAAADLKDEANMRHLFILPDGVPAPFTIHGRWV